ncbi:MAG: SRPBCC family protein [Chloroflexi bacterium]|nr:SRPBCC family protein [Chloroflexota bacterium]
MIDYQTEVIVNRPIEDVFRFAKDVSRFDDWTDMTGTHLVSNSGLGLGSQIETTLKLGPSKQKLIFEVSAYEENHRLGWKTASKGPLEWDADYIFEPQGSNATRVVSAGQIRLNGILKLSEPLMAGEIRSGEAKELVKFKELLEMNK